MISPGSIPLNIKVSRDVVFTLQKKLFILTVVRGYIRCEMTPTSVGGEQQNYIRVGFNLPSDIASGRIAEMHRRICHALHDVHLAARMPRAFLNLLSEYDERILLTFNATEHKIKAS